MFVQQCSFPPRTLPSLYRHCNRLIFLSPPFSTFSASAPGVNYESQRNSRNNAPPPSIYSGTSHDVGDASKNRSPLLHDAMGMDAKAGWVWWHEIGKNLFPPPLSALPHPTPLLGLSHNAPQPTCKAPVNSAAPVQAPHSIHEHRDGRKFPCRRH
jgi:hypothetical protein